MDRKIFCKLEGSREPICIKRSVQGHQRGHSPYHHHAVSAGTPAGHRDGLEGLLLCSRARGAGRGRAGRGVVPSHRQGRRAQLASAFTCSPVQPSRCFIDVLCPELLFFPGDHRPQTKLCDRGDRVSASCCGRSAHEVDISMRVCEALALGACGRRRGPWKGSIGSVPSPSGLKATQGNLLLSPLPLSRELRTPPGAGVMAGLGRPLPFGGRTPQGQTAGREDGMCRRYPGGHGCLHLLAAAQLGPTSCSRPVKGIFMAASDRWSL